MKIVRLLLSLWLCCLAGHAAAEEAMHIVRIERLIQSADASLPHPGKILPALPEQGWEEVALPDVAMQRTPGRIAEGKTQTTWYRFTLDAQRAQTAQELYFYLPRWQTVGQVALYGDRWLLWRSSGDPVWNGFNQPVWVTLDAPEMTRRPQVVLLRMDSVPGAGAGISTAWVGPRSALAWRYYTRMALQVYVLLATGIAFLGLGLFCLGVWRKRRHEILYLLCFLASLCFAGRYLHYVTPLNANFISPAWYGWVSVNAVNWLAVVILIFNFRLCRRHYRWLERGMIASVVLQSAVTLPLLESSEAIAALSSYVYLLVLLMAIPACGFALYAAWQEREKSGMLLALISLTGIPLGIHDMMLHGYRIGVEHVYLLPLAQIGFFIVFAFIILQRYLNGIEHLEHSRELLTQRLQQREAELADSYAKLREIEQRDLLSRERQRLMQDMHDGLGGALVGMMRMVDRGDLQSERLKTALQDSIDELRLTIDSLEPVGSDISVLLAGLRFRLQPRLEAAGVQLRWQPEALPPVPWLTPGYAMHLVRIVQEAVTNIVKHAGASEIVFATHADATHARICISDDGNGFAGGDNDNGGRGLRNMHYRAEQLGAVLRWQEIVDGGRVQGTRFTLELPLARAGL
ncbi:sensor histidine kinase [Oxalicibacterium solurbis]|uniref:Sensor histidine kinase n=1 Tax=Oxalicibacterium solurbis TaxID=69280 RepID=A0A8J3AXL9_9BURK|nr:ATP-binding protein [Oxalicibacterium solurbis]GGI54787.1 sensor histidine kinase [Oxalicibacterium solurbis]